MSLGTFSVSLSVKDINASKEFYVTLGFSAMSGDEDQGWLILRNGDSTIGLFQGMFEKNMLTFNPGWNKDANPLSSFEDIRDIKKQLRDAGLSFSSETDDAGSGPASFTVVDPDGNPVLFDQHV